LLFFSHHLSPPKNIRHLHKLELDNLTLEANAFLTKVGTNAPQWPENTLFLLTKVGTKTPIMARHHTIS
jgi:hypothetical protein